MTEPGIQATLAQLNPVPGDVAGNAAKIRETYLDADARGARLVICPELSVAGCPPESLTGNADLLTAVDAALTLLRTTTKGKQQNR